MNIHKYSILIAVSLFSCSAFADFSVSKKVQFELRNHSEKDRTIACYGHVAYTVLDKLFEVNVPKGTTVKAKSAPYTIVGWTAFICSYTPAGEAGGSYPSSTGIRTFTETGFSNHANVSNFDKGELVLELKSTMKNNKEYVTSYLEAKP